MFHIFKSLFSGIAFSISLFFSNLYSQAWNSFSYFSDTSSAKKKSATLRTDLISISLVSFLLSILRNFLNRKFEILVRVKLAGHNEGLRDSPRHSPPVSLFCDHIWAKDLRHAANMADSL